jgi:plastocyanin
MPTPMPGARAPQRSARHRLTPAAVLGLASVLASAGPGAVAATLDVLVRDTNDRPVAGVVVQIETATAPAAAAAPGPVEIRQSKLKFHPATSVVPVGTAVSFVNEDEFDHHVRGIGQTRSFEFVLPAADPGAARPQARRPSATLTLTHPGVIRLGCHLHGSMQGHIVVTQAPFFGLTDADGALRVTGVPSGKAAVTLWHPFEIIAHSANDVNVVEPGISVALRMNFSLRANR